MDEVEDQLNMIKALRDKNSMTYSFVYEDLRDFIKAKIDKLEG